MLTDEQISRCRQGLTMLERPILPLVRLAGMLYLTGPFQTLDELLCELTEPVETGGLGYDNPAELLRPYREAMQPYERLKMPAPPSRFIVEENGQGADQLAALDGWVAQNVLLQELAAISSELCTPCDCTICCTGPGEEQSQCFFEIPLQDDEVGAFDLPLVDSALSRDASSSDEPPLLIDNRPFYQTPAALYHWRHGWSLILPARSACPSLDPRTGLCRIYPGRPEVCRRPPLFAYMLEEDREHDLEVEGVLLPAYVIRKKILAVWDCPFVRQFQEQIGRYAELCGLEPIFKQNKA